MSPSIGIITDTDSSLPQHLSEREKIYQVPINIHFGEEAYQTGIDINDRELFARVDESGTLPTTSAPTPGQFIKAFQNAFDDGAQEVLCFTVSGEVSATYSAALSAREMMADQNITVVDTRQLSIGQGFMVLEAARLAREGVSSQEVVQKTLAVGERVHLYAALSTLKYLAMSGRVGYLAAGMANLLSVRPILSVQEGKLDLLEKIRTTKKSWSRVVDLIGEKLDGKTPARMAIVHVNAEHSLPAFEALVRENLSCPEEIVIAELTPGLSVHSGAGMVGVCVVSAE